MAHIRTEDEADDLLDEIVDRYGEPPKAVLTLVAIALLRASASAAGISKIEQRENEIYLTMEEFFPTAISTVCAEPQYKLRLTFISGGEKPVLALKLKKDEDPLKAAEKLVKYYTAATKP